MESPQSEPGVVAPPVSRGSLPEKSFRLEMWSETLKPVASHVSKACFFRKDRRACLHRARRSANSEKEVSGAPVLILRNHPEQITQ